MVARCEVQHDCLPEWVGEVYGDAEVAAGLLHAVNADPQLPCVAAACGKRKDGKKLEGQKY